MERNLDKGVNGEKPLKVYPYDVKARVSEFVKKTIMQNVMKHEPWLSDKEVGKVVEKEVV